MKQFTTRSRPKPRRHGMTMLELVIASTMLTIVVTSVTLLLRSSREVWAVHESDQDRLESVQGLMRHVVRHARQAESVTAVSGSGDLSGALSLAMPSGEVWVWNHDAGNDEVRFGISSASERLADQIESFEVVGYEADGTTITSDTVKLQVLHVTATTVLPRDSNGTKTFESWIWVRAW